MSPPPDQQQRSWYRQQRPPFNSAYQPRYTAPQRTQQYQTTYMSQNQDIPRTQSGNISCYKCGRYGHIARNCTAQNFRPPMNSSRQMPNTNRPQRSQCHQCGRYGHMSWNCRFNTQGVNPNTQNNRNNSSF